jgi:16S rRNA (adenine1518-N6/adenine1519-N6)-dimethyltransferase
MGSLEETKRLLRSNRIVPNRLLGQNFLVDTDVLQALPEYASVGIDDVVLDVGAGFGSLSALLSQKCKTVIAVEKDAEIARVLQKQLANLSNVKVVESDVLRVKLPEFNKVVSIPPYQISSRLLVWLFGKGFGIAVLILQKEFARRLMAPIGSEDYGWLSVLAYYHVEVELLDTVPRTMFHPKPAVDSVVVRLRPKFPRPFAIMDEKLFVKIVRSLFTERNRKVKNALVPFVKGELMLRVEVVNRILETISFRETRVRELAPEDFGVIENAFVKQENLR